MRTQHVTGARGARFCPSLAVFLLVAGVAMGCAGIAESERAEAAAELVGAPGWVTQGCAARMNRICGVGSAGGDQNSALRRTAAIGRARTNIARSLQSRVNAMLADYAASTEGEPDFGLASSEEQHLADVSKQITNVTLAGTEVTDTWVSKDATLYALVTLDVAKFADTVSRMNQLSEDVRKAVVERADESFSEPVETIPASQ